MPRVYPQAITTWRDTYTILLRKSKSPAIRQRDGLDKEQLLLQPSSTKAPKSTSYSLPSKPIETMASKPTGSQTSSCPVCKTTVPVNPHYPNYLCWSCHAKATDAHGRTVTFHTSSTGAFEAHFKDDGSLASEVTKSHTVYVGALKAWADKSHKGGTVLMPYREREQPHGTCPVCHTSVSISPRYPNYLCRWCCDRAVDAQGRPLKFYNASASGGFEAQFKHDGSPATEVTENHTVYVGFLKVWADEARFGGIVLTPYREKRQ